jgi:hypothetical protein
MGNFGHGKYIGRKYDSASAYLFCAKNCFSPFGFFSLFTSIIHLLVIMSSSLRFFTNGSFLIIELPR